MEEKIICRVLTGPTASGKTALALRLAEEMGWSILSMDSMQIYRGMDIGTAKPSAAERLRVRHHLIDIRDPEEAFSVADYLEEALNTINRLHDEGKEFLFVGGTGLYLQALMHPMHLGSVPANEALRAELMEESLKPDGRKLLHDRLASIDPETASRLHENDSRRVIRALEVSMVTGIPFSAQPAPTEAESPFLWKVVSTSMPRPMLYDRINTRVDDMLRNGLEDEVRSLISRGVPDTAQSMQGLGYKEMIPCIRGETPPELARKQIQTGTRHYAKRQMTFFRREPGIRYVDVTEKDAYGQIRQMLA